MNEEMNYVRLLELQTLAKEHKSTIRNKTTEFKKLSIIMTFVIIYKAVTCDAIANNMTQVKRPDMLCNVGDEHECICNRSLGDMDGKVVPCDNFLEVKKLIVVCIKMRHVNLNARLYTNESYQQYFRRRIASILSSYCESQPQECPGTNVAIKHEWKTKQLRLQKEHGTKSDNNKYSKNTQSSMIVEDGEDEPEFILENVVLLKVTFDERNRTNVYFVVTKSTSVELLNNAVTLDPTKVKHILLAQIAPLSRVLGGIRIMEVKLAELKKPRPPYSNKSLIIVVIVVGVALSSCCIIAFIKLFRDQQKKAAVSQSAVQKYDKQSRNYGSCTAKFLPIYDSQNGKPKCKSLNNSTRSKKRKSTTCSLNTSYTPIEIEESGKDGYTEDINRGIKNLFKCDPSQLPRESCEFYCNKKAESISTRNERNVLNSVEYVYYNRPIDQRQEDKNASDNLPSVILVSSQSDAFYTAEANNNDQKSAASCQINAITNGALAAPVEIERPLSRRGSRESTPEQGAEQGGSSREDTPLPLGDGLNHDLQKQPNSKNMNMYSSSSESEEESKVYHPLEDYISDNEDNNDTITIAKNISAKNAIRPYSSNSLASSESDDNNQGEHNEIRMLDRHQYERLQESPIPPILVKNANLCYDNTNKR